ncbi:hypothetical protein ZIOFF_049471 [Zingiber officinale]|uniref:Beta-Casp domain-containing protein n=3 Tax=Zingiber officinale TaxID=94328 RepID=A0A8J5FWY8_ZINOF|nr:hypothetical protein ZIOFF_049471 [Zingiber officinale]
MHILQLAGFRFLLECPIDLSALIVFSPIAASDSSPAFGLLQGLPWYKTVPSLHLWDPSLIDVVLISSPFGMLGLPFLTCNAKFNAKIFVTEVAARIGQLLMEDLVSMHAEFVQCYGADVRPHFPEWMKWEELGKLSPLLKQVILGEGGEELGGWMPLYSAADIKECMQKIQPLKYGEETFFNGSIMLKAYSSGLDIGSCNWTIHDPRWSISYLSSSLFMSACWKGFDYMSLLGNDLVLFSDLSSLSSIDITSTESQGIRDINMTGDSDFSPSNASTCSADTKDKGHRLLLETDESSDETEKTKFICSCIIDSLQGGGSVLIPMGRIEMAVLLLEQICESLESFNIKVPIFMISSTAEEMLAYLNIVPECLSEHRQQKLFSGEALFHHIEFKKAKRLLVFPSLYTSDFLAAWQEPCVVFSSHWSLRLGPVVTLLRRWHADPNSLLILERGIDIELALLPYTPLAMKVLQCSILSGIMMHKVQPLLKILQPKLVLFPEDLRTQLQAQVNDSPPSYLYYTENVPLRVPSSSKNYDAVLETDLVVQLRPRKLTQQNLAIARLGGGIRLREGKYFLSASKVQLGSSNEKLLHWGSVEPARLLISLQERGLVGNMQWNEEAASETVSIRIRDPNNAIIETNASRTIIGCEDENVANLIYETFSSVCDGI